MRGLSSASMKWRPPRLLPALSGKRGYINLRQIVDMIDKNELSNCFFLFAGTPAFSDSSKGIRSLPPLYDRIGIIAEDDF